MSHTSCLNWKIVKFLWYDQIFQNFFFNGNSCTKRIQPSIIRSNAQCFQIAKLWEFAVNIGIFWKVFSPNWISFSQKRVLVGLKFVVDIPLPKTNRSEHISNILKMKGTDEFYIEPFADFFPYFGLRSEKVFAI